MNLQYLLLFLQLPFAHCYLCGCGSCRGVNGKACARCCTAYVKRGYPEYRVSSVSQQQQQLPDNSNAKYSGRNYLVTNTDRANNLYNTEKSSFEAAADMLLEYRRPNTGNSRWSALSLPFNNVQKSLIKILTLRTDVK